MARISTAERANVPAHLQHLYDDMANYGPFASLVGAMAHRGPIFEHVFGMLTDLRKEGVLPRRYLELGLVAVSKLNACEYCVAHHSPFLTIEGVTPAGVYSSAALLSWVEAMAARPGFESIAEHP